MARLLRGYLRLLEVHPFKTQVLTAATLMATGDVVCQTAVEKKSIGDLDFRRTGRFFIFGVCAAGPALRGWYVFLDKYVKGAPKIVPLKKLALDQFVFAPGFLVFFLSVMEYWKSASYEMIKEKLNRDYVTVLIRNYQLWPAVQILNFYFLPLKYRILYVNSIAIFWNTYLAYKSEAPQEEEDDINR